MGGTYPQGTYITPREAIFGGVAKTAELVAAMVRGRVKVKDRRNTVEDPAPRLYTRKAPVL